MKRSAQTIVLKYYPLTVSTGELDTWRDDNLIAADGLMSDEDVKIEVLRERVEALSGTESHWKGNYTYGGTVSRCPSLLSRFVVYRSFMYIIQQLARRARRTISASCHQGIDIQRSIRSKVWKFIGISFLP